MNLHEAIQSYIEELQELIKEPDPLFNCEL